jgi:hypothetical protein
MACRELFVDYRRSLPKDDGSKSNRGSSQKLRVKRGTPGCARSVAGRHSAVGRPAALGHSAVDCAPRGRAPRGRAQHARKQQDPRRLSGKLEKERGRRGGRSTIGSGSGPIPGPRSRCLWFGSERRDGPLSLGKKLNNKKNEPKKKDALLYGNPLKCNHASRSRACCCPRSCRCIAQKQAGRKRVCRCFEHRLGAGCVLRFFPRYGTARTVSKRSENKNEKGRMCILGALSLRITPCEPSPDRR